MARQFFLSNRFRSGLPRGLVKGFAEIGPLGPDIFDPNFWSSLGQIQSELKVLKCSNRAKFNFRDAK